ncbi:hypothetical protein JMG10_05400 [Nostoc ellipsosporum NOK]|nr:hypothetical protein [Nostoc ellipsosporum NOK]
MDSFRSFCRMNPLIDQSGEAIGYLHNNIILLPGNFDVTGVVLGHCVFSKSGKVAGKLFDQTFYTVDGHIVAEIGHEPAKDNFDENNIRMQAWEVIQTIKDHQCPWIQPKEHWAATPVQQLLQ